MGLTAYAWAALLCTAGPYPPTPSNLAGFGAWTRCEGTPTTGNNPLNTSSSWHRAGKKNSIVSTYANPITGARACTRSIKGMDDMRGWPAIDAAAKRGTLGRLLKTNAAGALSGWGTGPGCVADILGGSSPASQSSATTTGLSAAGSGSGSSGSGSSAAVSGLLASLPLYLEVAAGGAVLVFGTIAAVYGATGSHVVGKTAKKVGMAALVAA